MNRNQEHLELLISRFLDREASGEQQRELRRLMSDQPEAARLFDQMAALDREIGAALRSEALRGRTLPLCQRPVVRGALVSAGLAACLAGMLWIAAPTNQHVSDRAGSNASIAGSLFLPLPTGGDTFVPGAAVGMQPATEPAEPQREWIVVPAQREGEFLIIEIKRLGGQSVDGRDL